VSTVLHAEPSAFERASADLRFAAAVAGFGMLLRQSPHAGRLEFGDVERIAAAALGRDAHGYRREFIELVARAREVSNN
jgi:Ca-activated chloride channel family protein